MSCTVCLPEEGPLVREFERVGARVHIIELAILRKKYYSPYGLLDRSYHFLKAFHSLSQLARAIHADLVYSNTLAVLVGAAVARSMGLPHVWHIHEIISKPVLLRRFLSWSLRRRCEVGIAVSAAVKRHWDSSEARSGSVIRTVYNGIDADKFGIAQSGKLRSELALSQDHIIIGMIGRVHYWKGQEYFVKLASQIHKRYPSARFVMVGDAFPGYEHLYGRIHALISALELEGVVIDLGFRSDVPDLLVDFDIFVLPSTAPDPLPTVVLEAMATSKPVVATAHGGSVEMVVDGITGFLIPWDDEDKAFSIIEPMVRDKELRTRFGSAGRERVVRTFALSRYHAEIVEIVKQHLPRPT
jgi:glycosyltransferase involved in cell wall biosynthesis